MIRRSTEEQGWTEHESERQGVGEEEQYEELGE